MRVTNFTVYNDNPYHELLYCNESLELERGNIDDALSNLKVGAHSIFHIHWEEHLLRKSLSESEANALVAYFLSRLTDFQARGGKILLTIHNSRPHELNYEREFVRLRQGIINLADKVLVHNMDAASEVVVEYRALISKIFYLPHPSYVGYYEEVAATKNRIESPSETEKFIIFGKIREYKAVDKFLVEWSKSDTNLQLDIVGSGLQGESYIERVRSLVALTGNVFLYEGHVRNQDLVNWLGNSKAVILPYERFLTSGVLLLALSFGLPVIAPRQKNVLEVLPADCHEFCFEPGNYTACIDKMQELSSLANEDYSQLRKSCFERALNFEPKRISGILNQLCETLVD